MQEETQVNNPEKTKAADSKPAANKDYLAPALVFIALFFSFFVLITMQRLSRKAIGLDDQYGTSKFPMETVPNTVTNGQTAPSEPMNKETDTVGDELIKDIDTTTSTDANAIYNADDLNDLNQ